MARSAGVTYMDEERREEIERIVDDINRDVSHKETRPDKKDVDMYSKDYKQYKKEEKIENRISRYERLCQKMGNWINLTAGEKINSMLSPPLRLLRWDITPGMVLSASVGVGFLSFLLWISVFLLNTILGSPIPSSMILIFGLIPFVTGLYTFYKPIYDAQNKVIKSSGEMILTILYMVIYLRSSPNLEGAVRFAALNLKSPISKDLKEILWEVEVGKYNRLDESLENYTKSWKGYNDNFLQSLQLLKASVNERDPQKREELLQDSIDRILNGTREKMKHYAQGLKMPVMVLNAMGAMLPVLGMIMLPLVSVFVGDVISEIHLFLLFNILLPGFLYWFMQRILSSRPPTINSKPVSNGELPPKGYYPLEISGKNINIPAVLVGMSVFIFIAGFGIVGYISFPDVYPINFSEVDYSAADIPLFFQDGDGLDPFRMLLRSVAITSGLGIGIGVSKILGNMRRKEAIDELREIEGQFPAALFELGNKVSGGTPIELALQKAAKSSSDMEISSLFDYTANNVNQMGMTFEKALFDKKYGSLKHFPSQMIHTVMRAITESSSKGSEMAAMAMKTVSRYLENIHQTQENLNDLLEETTTTIQMLAFLLAPVVSGVAVGMSQTIIIAMFELSESFADVDTGQAPEAGAGAGMGSGDYSGIIGNLDSAIAPEVLQFVVGIYLIQLLFILGTFFMKIKHGEDETYRDLFVGKTIIVGIIIYSITILVITLLFGGIVPDDPTM